MRVLITGGNGFVGLNVVEALNAAGHSVTALVRPNSDTRYLDNFEVIKIKGELTDTCLLRQAMEGMDGVIHTAGITSSDKNDMDKLRQTNVAGTQNVCNSALDMGVKRLVYTSTTSTIGADNCVNSEADEKKPLTGFRAKNPYGISKIEAEKIVLDAVDKGMECIILNPAEVVGPYDYNFQWGRIVLAVFHNSLPFMPPGGGSFCHSREVGRAHVSALTNGQPGEKYILSGPRIPYREYIQKVVDLLDRKIDIPGENYWKTYIQALMHEKIPAIFKQKPAVEAYRMRVFAGHYYFSSDKAKKELGYQVSSLDQMVKDCIAWYRTTGILSTN